MEALLANYASDDDEESSRPPPRPLSRPGLFSSLPAPKSAAVIPPSSQRDAQPSIESSRRSKDVFDEKIDAASGKRSSLFSALPPPRTSRGPSLPRTSGKRVVEFRPTVNMAVLKEDEDDKEERSKLEVKRQAVESEGPIGLAAVLPKPKYTGSVLGGGFASGRCTALDMNDHQPKLEGGIAPEITSAGQPDESASAEIYEPPPTVDAGGWVNYSSEYTVSQGAEGLVPPYVYQSASLAPDEQYHGVAEPDYSLHQAHEAAVFSGLEQQNAEAPTDPIASILMRERHKGGRNGPPTIVEVKQSELTANRIREDQLRTTGIAFGPAYKPTSGKGKPTKLHRRKHQIGSLYYDMKQKEMELIERRSRGYMTKAETQAKYGW